jgi:hypothetical protein
MTKQATPTTAENRDERDEAVPELVGICGRISEALSCAETCETNSDLDANVRDAIAAAKEFLNAALETWPTEENSHE